MPKSSYKFIREIWKKPKERLGQLMKDRGIKWRASNTVERIDKPTRLDRARGLGYKAKKGYVLARVKIKKGGRRRRADRRGRKPRSAGLTHFTFGTSKQVIAERRANKRFKNLEVLGSYPVGQDGRNHYFEILMVDPKNPSIQSDPKINWICQPQHRSRAFRGLTTSAKKSRKS